MEPGNTDLASMESTFTVDEPFLSPYLKNQSVYTEDGIHVSCIPPTISMRLKHIRTLNDVFLTGLNKSENAECFGVRSSADQPYEWMSYKAVDSQIRGFGSAMLSLVGRDEDTDNFVGIYSRNCPEWLITSYACGAYGFVFVPLYDTFGAEAVQYILSSTEPRAVVCYSMKEVTALLATQLPSSVQYILVVQKSDDLEHVKAKHADQAEIFLFSEFVELGRKSLRPRSPSPPDSLCTVCYTSGSTGVPKGVMLRHEQIITCLWSALDTGLFKFLQTTMVHLSYLPLAHIFEQLCMTMVLLIGGRAAFLTRSVDMILSDLQSVRPTLLVAVPRVLGRLRMGYYKKLPKLGLLRRCLQRCIEKRIDAQAHGKYYTSDITSTFFFRKFRALLGGRIQFVACGSAPLSADDSRFIRAALDCPLIEGYGMTETAGVVSMTLVGERECNITGALTSGMEAKLCDVPDMGISVDKDGVGEIRVRGLRCTAGYYKDPKNTEALYDPDGWMCTGEIGQWTASNALKIVDRCKNMFKLMHGEYLAPEKIEAIYQSSPFVLFTILDGNSSQTFAVVIVVADMPVLRVALDLAGIGVDGQKNLATSQSVTDEQICSNIHVRRYVLRDLNSLAKQSNLKGFEMAKSLHLSMEPFTIENGLLTPTMKVARRKARLHFKDTIAKLYDEGEL